MAYSDLTIEELFHAYYDCRRHKRNTHNALQFEENLERNLMDLYYDLLEDNYTIGRSICFAITYPKPREIWAADFRDRVVQHLIYNRYIEQIDNSFIHDSYACRVGKGNLKAAERLHKFMRSASENYTKRVYYLKCDIANFFVSINKFVLLGLLSKHITNPWWSSLTRKIILNDPRKSAIYKGSNKDFDLIPRRKSLLYSPWYLGLPVGNLMSQTGGNVYLNLLDQFVKHTLKVKYYIRYVDDMVLLSTDPKQLTAWYNQMKEYVQYYLGLLFQENKTQINTIDKGIDFVGYILKPYRKYVRRMSTSNMKNKILENNGVDKKPSINSYMGLLIHANTYKFRQSIADRLGKELFNAKYTKVTANEIF